VYDVAVIGAGPAGLAATIYCIRKGIDVLLIAPTLGGKTTATINFPEMTEYHVLKAKEQVQVFRARIEYLAHTYRLAQVTEVADKGEDFRLTLHSHSKNHTEQISAKRLIIATGVRGEYLDIPGERKFAGRGVGASAVSYTHALKDRPIFLLGNSDRVIEAAVEASFHAAQVYLVLEPHADYTHQHLELAAAIDNIQVFNGYRALGFDGDDFATQIEIQRADAPAKTIQADAFFLEREPEPNSALVRHLVECNERGYIRINERNCTSHRRIYGAGDVTTVGMEQILIALGEGARAGLSAYRHITMQET